MCPGSQSTGLQARLSSHFFLFNIEMFSLISSNSLPIVCSKTLSCFFDSILFKKSKPLCTKGDAFFISLAVFGQLWSLAKSTAILERIPTELDATNSPSIVAYLEFVSTLAISTIDWQRQSCVYMQLPCQS
jgi:hypothetical protein